MIAPAFKAELDRLEREEMPLLDAILSVRKEATTRPKKKWPAA